MATTLFGDTRVDDYFWLREKTNRAVHDHLKAENAYARAMLKPTAALQKKLFAEMRSHLQETDTRVPYRKGDWLYYHRTVKGQKYAIHCRKRSANAPEEVMLDLNQLAKGLEVSAESLYVRAGLLDPDEATAAGRPDTRTVIKADPRLTSRQKGTLLDIYDSFVGDEQSAPPASTTKTSTTTSGNAQSGTTKTGARTTRTRKTSTSPTTNTPPATQAAGHPTEG